MTGLDPKPQGWLPYSAPILTATHFKGLFVGCCWWAKTKDSFFLIIFSACHAEWQDFYTIWELNLSFHLGNMHTELLFAFCWLKRALGAQLCCLPAWRDSRIYGPLFLNLDSYRKEAWRPTPFTRRAPGSPASFYYVNLAATAPPPKTRAWFLFPKTVFPWATSLCTETHCWYTPWIFRVQLSFS